MDAFHLERRFARCSQLWDAARSRRNFRTHWQDEADKRIASRIRSLFRAVRSA
jgi:hypothetical protein